MKAAEAEFASAVARIRRRPLAKLVDPGARRFLERWLARRRPPPTMRRARLFFGQTMEVALPEPISEQLFTYGFFDEAVTWLALRSVRPGVTVIDVGAHFGYFTLLFAHLVGPEGKVVAFEPTGSTFDLLRRNAGDSANVTVANLALGSAEGSATIADFGLVHSAWNTLAGESRMPGVLDRAQARQAEVRVATLDRCVARDQLRPDFIKIDAENYELEVVSGALDTLKRLQPKVLMETGSEPAARAGRLLEQLGYEPFVSSGLGSLEHWTGSVEAVNERYKDVLFVPRGAPAS